VGLPPGSADVIAQGQDALWRLPDGMNEFANVCLKKELVIYN
jgi:hypothetical protein